MMGTHLNCLRELVVMRPSMFDLEEQDINCAHLQFMNIQFRFEIVKSRFVFDLKPICVLTDLNSRSRYC